LFVCCIPFAAYVVYLPLAYWLSPNDPYRGEMLEGWFWLSLYGFIPAILLAIFSWLQRRSVPRRILAAWALPTSILLASGAILFALAVAS
jgi:hypothetical protein